MHRRLVAAALPALAVAFAWSRLELNPGAWPLLAAVAVGLTAALPRVLWQALGVAVTGTIGVVAVVLGGSPAGAGREAEHGLREFYAVALPFDGQRHTSMHALVMVAVACFAAALGVWAGRRPFAGAVCAGVGVGWPATLVPARDTVAIGALALGAALWPFLAARPSALRVSVPGLAALVAIVVVASSAAAAGVKPSRSAVDWEQWDLFGGSQALGVTLVWDANYGGIEFPARTTTVLKITAPRRALYWRASTLDSFLDDRWVEALYSTGRSAGERTLPPDPLLPPAARSRRDWVEQRVEVAALVDDHLVAAGQPVRLSTTDADSVIYMSGGVMRVQKALRRGQRYDVWSYAPRPSPAGLVRSPARYPAAARRYLDLGRAISPPFGAPGRAAEVDALFTDQLYVPLWPYRGLWREAQRQTRGARSPYEATVAIEGWLRDNGGFTYDEHPPRPAGLPPLADFVERSKRGYCQQFAGSMALMLRMLGIPARVAVGFTSGEWNRGTWTVTDHDAHAWVEAWFAGYGWLAFDPTPGRGTLSASYTLASDSADARRALGGGRFLDFSGDGQSGGLPTGSAAPAPAVAGSRPGRLLLPLALLLVPPAGLVALKAARRRRSYATRDPRVTAAATRTELARFLRDQGVAVPADAPMRDLRRETERLGVGVDAFAAAFGRARYGPPESAGRAAADARRELGIVIRVLRERIGPGRRLRGLFALKSLRRA